MNRTMPQPSASITAATAPAKVTVDLGERSYAIDIAENLLAGAGHAIAPLLARKFTVIVSDENVAAAHLDALEQALDAAGIAHSAIVLPAGEATKSNRQLCDLCDQLLAAGVERNDVIIAFGGGVIGDITGFAAAILRRGVNFVQMPTSLLAQVDSSVGGKTGINSPHGKNLIGAFHQPLAVIADISLLHTLPARQLAAGYAEVAKYGLLGDADFFTWLEQGAAGIFAGDNTARIHAVEKSCLAKAAIVAADELEKGNRALLNLGHTFGHALEAATGYGARLLHGEGVAIGTVLAFKFSERLGHCPPGTHERVARHFASVGLPVSPRDIQGPLPGAAQLLEIMRQDKKTETGRLVFILVKGIGQAFVARDVDEAVVLAFLAEELAAQ